MLPLATVLPSLPTNETRFCYIVATLPRELQDKILLYVIRASCYQALIDFALNYPRTLSDYPSPPQEHVSLYKGEDRQAKRKKLHQAQPSSSMSILVLNPILNEFDYVLDYGTVCLQLKHCEIRLRSISLQSQDGHCLLKSLALSKMNNIKLIINHPPGIQEAMKIMKFTKQVTLDNKPSMEFYINNMSFFNENIAITIGHQLTVAEVGTILTKNQFSNLRSINISIYDKEITPTMIENMQNLIKIAPANLIFNCHVTYPSLSELTYLNDSNVGSSSLKLLSDFHQDFKTKSRISYEVFLFFVDSSHQFTKFINCSDVHQLYVCHPGTNTTDFKKLEWFRFNELRQMHVKVLHLYMGYLIDCLPINLKRLKLNFGSFRKDMEDTNKSWKIPPTILELELDTFPTGEGPLEAFLSCVDWSEAQVKKLCLCWNKVFDTRGHMSLLVKSLPESLELLDISGCGYEVVLICDEIPEFVAKNKGESQESKCVYYSGEYGCVTINIGDIKYKLTWIGKA